MLQLKFRMPIFNLNNEFQSFYFWGFNEYMDFIAPAQSISELNTDFRKIQEQYTGLKDSMGIEMYAGDIISVNGKYPKIIEYSAQHFGFVLINISDLKHKSWKEIKQRPSSCWFDDYKREIKVIGNIHKNSDLLSEP